MAYANCLQPCLIRAKGCNRAAGAALPGRQTHPSGPHAARIPLAECGQGACGKLWHLRHRHGGRRHRAVSAGSLNRVFLLVFKWD